MQPNVALGSHGKNLDKSLGQQLTRAAAAARFTGARKTSLEVLAPSDSDLDRVIRVVKLNGFVNVTPDFDDILKIINGCSDLMVQVFGETGKHARSAVGVANLPLGFAVEVDAVFAIAT